MKIQVATKNRSNDLIFTDSRTDYKRTGRNLRMISPGIMKLRIIQLFTKKV